jgi:hypothetical protein
MTGAGLRSRGLDPRDSPGKAVGLAEIDGAAGLDARESFGRVVVAGVLRRTDVGIQRLRA